MITDNMVQLCLNDLNSWGGITMSLEQGRKLIDASPDMNAILFGYYRDRSATGGLDTEDRDTLFDEFARQILGRKSWPTFGDKVDMNEFGAEIAQAVTDGKIVAFEAN